MSNRLEGRAIFCVIGVVVGLTSSCSTPGQLCDQIVKKQVRVPYEGNPEQKASDHFQRFGPIFVVYISAGDYFPLTVASQDRFIELANAKEGEIGYIPVGWEDLPHEKCKSEIEKVDRFATQWNDKMFRLMTLHPEVSGVKARPN